jgi:hypothetical protein
MLAFIASIPPMYEELRPNRPVLRPQGLISSSDAPDCPTRSLLPAEALNDKPSAQMAIIALFENCFILFLFFYPLVTTKID